MPPSTYEIFSTGDAAQLRVDMIVIMDPVVCAVGSGSGSGSVRSRVCVCVCDLVDGSVASGCSF